MPKLYSKIRFHPANAGQYLSDIEGLPRKASRHDRAADPFCDIDRRLFHTLLAPDIVEAILDGRQPAGLQLDDLLKPFPVEWQEHGGALWGALP